MQSPAINLMLRFICLSAIGTSVTGCATAQLQTSGSLASYDGLAVADGLTTKSKLRIDTADVLAARTIAIMPTTFSGTASRAALTEKQQRVIANAVDRSLCIGVSDRFEVVAPGQPADLTVHVTLTGLKVTDAGIAGASKVASAVPMFISAGFPIIVPRIPAGLGGLAAEAEARDQGGHQRAAFVWARDADIVTSTPRVAASGDAYDLAKELGTDFSKLLNTAKNPFDNSPAMPTMQRVKSSFGGKPKYAACDAFGRDGVPAFIGGRLGAPPEWNDDASPISQ
jgi:hypothetical protein